MARYAKYLVVVAALALSISCGGKKTAEGEGQVGNTSGDPGVENKEMSFNASGSDSGSISGLFTVNFEFDQATLSSDARNKLQENAKWIKERSKVVVQVEGHCDSRGSIEYNLALGERRAKSVKSYLVGLGVDARALTIISYGEEKPLESGESEGTWAKNRRANFLPIGK